ncbi:RICIN domain-containing protein [Streptomyces caeruleatus]
MTRQTDPARETPPTASSPSGATRAGGSADASGSSGVTIRRAVPLQGTAQDPGTALTPGAGRPKANAEPTAPVPSPAPGTSSTSAAFSAPARPEGAPTGPVRVGNADEGAEGASEAGEEQAGSTAGKTESASAPAEPGAAASAPDTTASEPEADTVVVAGGSGGEGPAAVGQAHSGPKKPMLAAAAIVGAILIGVPFLVAGQGDKEERGSDRTDNAAGTVLDADQRPQASESYATQSPSPSPSTSSSPSKSPEEKQPKGEKAVPVAQEKKASPTASRSAKPSKGKAPTLSSAEKLRQKANAASSAGNILLKNSTTGLCADVPNYGNGKIDGPVNQYPCNGTTGDNQLWNLEVAQAKGGPQGASLFLIRNSKDKFCMDLPYFGAAAAGTNVTEYHCRATSDNQLWWLDPRSDGSYWIRSYSSNNLCLGLEGGASAGNDAHLEIGGCGSADRWIL